MPRVFIGIPTLNRPDYVRHTVQSVIGQSFQDWRVLISDNASRPENAAAVSAFVEELHDPRIAYHLQPKNIREYGNCDWLFRQAREEYFVILHDDDLLEPTHLETALNRLDRHSEIAAFCSNAKMIDSHGKESAERTAGYRRARHRENQADGPIRILEPLLRSGFVPISGTVIRRASLQKSGFVDEDCFGLWPFEVNLLLRLGERDERVWFACEELVCFRFHEGQMQRYQAISDDPVAVGMLLCILERRRFQGEAERLRRRLNSIFLNFRARIAIRRDDLQTSRRHLVSAIRTDPFWIRHWPLAFCAFLAPPLARRLVRHIDARPPREL